MELFITIAIIAAMLVLVSGGYLLYRAQSRAENVYMEQINPGRVGLDTVSFPTMALATEAQELLRQGKRIEAIKRYRESTGAGLKESRDVIQALEAGARVILSTEQRHHSTPQQPLSEEQLRAEVMHLLARGKKIQSIKHYREQTGAGLKEAKDAVEAWERFGSTLEAGSRLNLSADQLLPSTPQQPLSEEQLHAEVMHLLVRGKKIQAIKHYREQTGAGLKEAKDAVEAWERSRSMF